MHDFLKHALHLKTRRKATGETGGPCPSCSGKFQALRSWRRTWVRTQNAPNLVPARLPLKDARHGGAGPPAERLTAAGRRRPGAPIPEARWRLRPERSSRSAPEPCRPPQWLPARANTHLGALGRRRSAPGSRPPAPTPQAASQRPKSGRLRTDARRASDSRGLSFPGELVSRPPPLVRAPPAAAASGSGNAAPGLRPRGHLPASRGD